jgi:hypothetical protein
LKWLCKRSKNKYLTAMRTLLDASLPPDFGGDQSFSAPENPERTFSETPVLATVDNLVEVGVGGAVISAPGATNAEAAVVALERGVAIFLPKAPRSCADDGVSRVGFNRESKGAVPA